MTLANEHVYRTLAAGLHGTNIGPIFPHWARIQPIYVPLKPIGNAGGGVTSVPANLVHPIKDSLRSDERRRTSALSTTSDRAVDMTRS